MLPPTPSAAPRHSLTMGLLLLALGVALLGVLFVTATGQWKSLSVTNLIALGGLFLCALVFIVGSRSKRFDPLEVVYPITALFALNYPVRALFIEFFPDQARLSKYWPAESNVEYALLVSTLGMLCFFAGYFLNRPGLPLNWIPRISAAAVHPPSTARILLLYLVGLAAWLVLFGSGYGLRFQWQAGAVGAFDYVLRLLGMMRLFSLFFAWSAELTRGGKRGLALFLLLLEILLGVAIGSKQDILNALIAVLFAHHYLGRRNFIPVAMIVGVVFLFGLTPVVQTYRDVYAQTVGYQPMPTLDEVGLVVEQMGDALQDRQTGWFLDTLTYLSNRAASFDTVVLITNLVPSTIEYQNGSTLMSAVYGLIPRAIWPNKPNLNLGGYVTLVIFGSKSATNTPLTDIGEFYLNFGFVGVMAGMFLLGNIYRSLVWYCLKAPNLYQVSLYLAIFPNLLFGQTGVGTIFVSLSRILLLFLFVTWFLRLNVTRLYMRPAASNLPLHDDSASH